MPRFESGLSRKSGMVHEGRDDRAKGVGKSQVNTFWDKVTTGDRLHVDDWQSYLSTQPSHTLPFGAVVLTQPCLVNAMTYRQSIDSVVSYGSLQRIHEVDGVRTKLSLGLNRGLDASMATLFFDSLVARYNGSQLTVSRVGRCRCQGRNRLPDRVQTAAVLARTSCPP